MFRRSMPLFKKHVENWKVLNHLNMPVVKNARQVLIQLYRKTLEEIKQVPVTAAYRQNVEGITKYRLTVCENTHSHKEIELAIEAGTIEDIIEQAKMELELIPFLLDYQPWEVPEDWKPFKMNIDGFYFDWVKLRQDRVEESFKMRSELTEEERKEMLDQWYKDSNPDLEIYPKELTDHKSKGVFFDMTAFKGIRFGA